MTYFIHNSHHPENGRNLGRNMLLRKLWIKYIMDIVVHYVGYLYTWVSQMKKINIFYLVIY